MIEGVRLGRASSEVRVILEHDARPILLSVISVEPRRIEAWMPSSAPVGQGSLSVETSEGTSKPFPIGVVPSQPGLFTANGKGWGPGKIDNVGSDGRRRANTVETPARPGEMAGLLATGLGDGKKVEVMVGGRAASSVESHGASERGLNSILFRLPADVPKGCYVPVYARVRGATRSNVVTMAISDRDSCEMPAGWPSTIGTGRKLGLIGVSRRTAFYQPDQPTVTIDEAFGAFHEQELPEESNRLLLVPPVGTCTSYTALYQVDVNQIDSVAAALANPSDPHTLDAGAQFTISGSGESRAVSHSGSRPGVYWARLGLDDPTVRRKRPLFLNDPQFPFSVPGGTEVPAFSGTLPGIPALDWTNRDALASIQRSTGATFAWRDVPDGALVLILTSSFDPSSTAGGICYCAASAEMGHLRIPPEMFAQFPASGHVTGSMRSGAALAVVRTQPAKYVRGMDLLRLVSVFMYLRRTEFE
jgi:uncharacterized protein (TIGR03437 family)